MFSFLWDFFVILGALLSLPRFLYRFRKNPSLKRALREKMGFNFPIIASGRPVVWIHAVSVGEVKAVSSLTEKLKAEIPGCSLIVSTITLTGNEEAKKSILCADHILFLPFDISWIMKSVFKKIRPTLLVITETDFWFQFLKYAKKAGATVVLVNGKISERSALRLKKFSFVSRRLFSHVDLFLVQSEEYEKRFLALQVPRKKIFVTGNLKLDAKITRLKEDEKELLQKQLGLDQSAMAVVFASTHPGEEELAIQLAKELKGSSQGKIIIVPRHPERFSQVASALQLSGLPYLQLSKPGNTHRDASVVLVDRMGLLSSIYQITDIAVVCGSFTPIGGHNIIEPMPFNVPVLFGPHMFKQPEFTALAQKYSAGRMVSAGDLSRVVQDLLSNAEKRVEMGQAGVRLVADNQGALERTLQKVFKALQREV